LSFSLWIFALNIARRRHILGFEAEGRRSPVQAGTRRRIDHAAEIFFAAYCVEMLASGGDWREDARNWRLWQTNGPPTG